MVLITGAYGFIGRNVSLEYHKNGYSVVGIGLEPEDKDFSSKWGLDVWHECDIAELAKLGNKYKFDTIVHCAGGSSVGYAMSHPEEDFNNTVRGTLSVLQYIREFQPWANLIYLSSAAVYGHNSIPTPESASTKPVSTYGLHKKLAEELCTYYSDSYNLNVRIVRIFSAYGNGLKKQLLWDACNKIIDGNYEFFGVGDEIRDWVHVKDIASAIFFIDKCVQEMVINLASGVLVTTKEILTMLVKELNVRGVPKFNGEEHKGNPKNYLADVNLLRKYGWNQQIPLEGGVKDYVGWFRTQR